MKQWNMREVSDGFRTTADLRDRYLREMQQRSQERGSNYSALVYDQNLAEFYVFNYLHGRTFLQTKESLLSELKEMLGRPPERGAGANSQNVFKEHWLRTVQNLIDKYSMS